MRCVLLVALVLLGVVLMGRTAAGRIGFGMGYAPLVGDVVALTSPNDGGWPAQTGAYEHGGATYFGWVDGDGNIEAAKYDGSVTKGTIRAALEADHHNSPALLRRVSDGRIVTAYSEHDGQLYRKISTNADDISAWGSALALTGGASATYPNLFQLTDETNDPIYLFFRNHDGTSRLTFKTSTDGGSTWSANTELYSNTGAEAFWRIDSNGTDRLDFVVTDGSGGTASAYHFYYQGGSYFQTDGTAIVGSPPFDKTDLTKIYDGASAGVRYPASLSAYGGAITAGLVTQPGGSPPNDYRYLRYVAGVWTDNLIVGSGNDPGGPMFEGGFAIDYVDPDVVYLSKFVDSQWQVFRYETADAGATWTSEQLTSTTDPSFYPVPVRDRTVSGLKALWLNGPTFISQSNFSLGISGKTR